MIKFLLLVVWLLVGSTLASVTSPIRDSSPRDISRRLDDGNSWPVGTKVYYEFDDGWYQGTITDYDDDGYTITWSDDSKDIDDFEDETVDQMVQNYQTMVANNDGTDNSDSEPTPAPTEDDSWPVGTKVYWEFDDGWYDGTITDYDADGYTITWSDASQDYDDFDDADVDKMVENYKTMVANNDGTDYSDTEPTPAPTVDDAWPIGTKVYWEFDDGWYEGTITDYDDDGYSITWSDDSQDIDDFEDETVDKMVENYQVMVANGGVVTNANSSGGGMKPGAVFVIVAVVLLVVFGGVFYVWRARKNGKEEMQELHGANREVTQEMT